MIKKQLKQTGSAGHQPGSMAAEDHQPGSNKAEDHQPGSNKAKGHQPSNIKAEDHQADNTPRPTVRFSTPDRHEPLQWTDRGYMVHVNGQDLTQHVSYHLADSLPKAAVEQMVEQLKSLPANKRTEEKERNIARYLDAGKGSCVLRVPEIATLVQDAFLVFHNERYMLHQWCVMPNHVHVLFQPINGWSMSKIIATWKSYTGRRISEYIQNGNSGITPLAKNRVWHPEYWDRYVRDNSHYDAVVNYIRMNPVKAGLVTRPEDWQFSSAGSAALPSQKATRSE